MAHLTTFEGVARRTPITNRPGLKPAVIAFLSVVMITVTVFCWAYGSRRALFVLLMIYLLALIFAPPALRIARGGIDPLEPVYLVLVVYFIFFAFTPIYFFSKAGLSYLDYHPIHLAAVGMSLVGLIGFYAGYYSKLSRNALRAPYFGRNWNTTRAVTALFILAGFATLSVYVFCSINHIGFLDLALDVDRQDKFYIAGGATYIAAIISLFDVVAVAGGCLLLSRFRLKGLTRIVLIALVAVSAGVNILWTGSRIHLVLILVAFLIQFHYLRHRLKLLWLAGFLIALIVFSALFLVARSWLPYAGVDQTLGLAERTDTVHDILDTEFYGGDLDFYSNMIDVMQDMPQRLHFLHGESYYKIFFIPIPRQIWPGKPESVTRIFVKVWKPLSYDLGYSAGTGILGEAFMNFGWFGIPAVMFVFGYLLKWVFKVVEANRFNASIILLYSSTLFVFLFETMRGEFEGAFVKALMWGLTVWVYLKFVEQPSEAQ